MERRPARVADSRDPTACTVGCTLLGVNLHILASNGVTIPMPAEGFRLSPDVSALLARYAHGRTGVYFVCTLGEDRRLYILNLPGMLRRLVGLRDAGRDPVIPLDEVVADFTIPIRS